MAAGGIQFLRLYGAKLPLEVFRRTKPYEEFRGGGTKPPQHHPKGARGMGDLEVPWVKYIMANSWGANLGHISAPDAFVSANCADC